ncbi:MAG: adenylate/guanylate cyclase domain-containing protein [Dehalococcoidia bacterium]
MEPRIQYAKTSDGVSIAFWEMGEGPPLLYMPPLLQHVQLDWQFENIRRMYEWLAVRHRLIRFDRRNSGLSQRAVDDVSSEVVQLDISAVVDRLGLDQFHLFAHATSASTAVRFVVSHPDRVFSLILLDASLPRLTGLELTPPIRAVFEVLEYDWEAYTEMLAGIFWGWGAGEQTHQYAGLLRESSTWEDAKRGLGSLRSQQIDLAQYRTQFLSRIAAPTLIVHHREAIGTPIETGRVLASEITHARFVGLEGRGMAASYTDPRMMAAVDEFLAEVEGTSVAVSRELPSGTAIILFADIVDSTGLTERLGDRAFRDKARELDGALRSVIQESDGTAIEGKLLGDGVLAVFTSARQAIEAALRCGQAGEANGLPLHLGLHAGDVIREEGNAFGGAVNVAARIAAESAPGEVLVSETVRSLARTSAGVTFEDRGEQSLKGIGEPQRLFAVKEGQP